jgi:hypothetical protein
MARMSVAEFFSQVKQVCDRTDFVVRIVVWAKSQRQLKLRIILNDRSVIAAYYNCENGKMAYYTVN